MKQKSQVIGSAAGTLLKPDKDRQIAWDDHRIKYFSGFCSGKVVLDIGCVHHNPENYLSKYWDHKSLHKVASRVGGIDLNKEGVECLRGYDIRLADACNFDLREKFDVIVAGDVIEHLDNPGGFLDCCFRHLVDNGALLISTDNPWFWKHLARAIVLGRVKNNLEHVTWIDPVLLRQLAERHKFEFEETEVVYAHASGG